MSYGLYQLEQIERSVLFLQKAEASSIRIKDDAVRISQTYGNRLEQLGARILPFYRSTKTLQISKENIRKMLNTMDSIISYYSVKDQVESIIRQGPNCDLNQFMEALSRLQRAICFFDKDNRHDVNLEDIIELFETGQELLVREFKDLLVKHGKIIPPVVFMQSISYDRDVQKKIPQFPPEISKALATIANWFTSLHEYEFINVYCRFRAGYVTKSMVDLRNYLQHSISSRPRKKSRSFRSTSTTSPLKEIGCKTFNSLISKRLPACMERKMNQMLLTVTANLEDYIGMDLRERNILLDNGIVQQDVGNFVTEYLALLRLLQSELEQMHGIIPFQHHKSVLTLALREALEFICKDMENLCNRAMDNIAVHDFGFVLMLFPILRHVEALDEEWRDILQDCDPTNLVLKFPLMEPFMKQLPMYFISLDV